jgi:hypothetical protein
MIEGRDSNFNCKSIRPVVNEAPQLIGSDIYEQNQATIIQLKTKNT